MMLAHPPSHFDISQPQKFSQWLSIFDDYLVVCEITKALTCNQKHSLLKNCLGANCVAIIEGLVYDKAEDKNYLDLRLNLENYFLPKKNVTYERYQFRKRVQQPDEKCAQYLNALTELSNTCEFEKTDVDTVKNLNIKDQLIIGLRNNDIRQKLLENPKFSLAEATNCATTMENSKLENSQMTSASSFQSSELVMGVRNVKICTYCKKQGHEKVNCFAFKKKGGNDSSEITCTFCSKSGHLEKDCFRKRNNSNMTEITCFHCKKKGHKMAQCYQLKPNRGTENQDKTNNTCNSLFNVNEDKSDVKKLEFKVFDCDVVGVVDTGASISLLSESFIKKHQLISLVKTSEHTVNVANGEEVKFDKKLEAPVSIQDNYINASFYVSKNLPCQCIIGMNILSKFSNIKLNSSDAPSLLLSVLPETLKSFEDIFDKKLEDACAPNTPEPIVKLQPDARPYQCKVRRLSNHEEMVCQDQIPKLLASGIIRKSSSQWRHHPVIVEKKTGGHRIAINYFPVNQLTLGDAFPIPNIEQLLEQLDGAKVFSSLDFAQFYYQLPLHTDDIDKTAFYALGELYEFTRCPFGLKNAVSYCCRTMKHIFEGISGIVIYLDDILIFGKDKIEHDKTLIAVLNRIREAKLSLNLNKCSFYKDEITYLGHKLKDGTMAPDPERISAILHYKVPKSIAELERFIGMTSYFRNYIPNLAQLSSDLFEMKRLKLLNWSSQALQRFQTIKDLLSKSVLSVPAPDEELTLLTDASNDCLGACLVNNKNQPIAFASRRLTEVEQRWSTIDKEAIAIVWAVTKFRTFLLARKFIVKSDHQPLKYLFNTAKVSGKIHRWRLLLGEFDFKVEYIEGKENVVADFYSRVYSITSASIYNGEICVSMEEVRDAQKTDEESKWLYKSLKHNFLFKPTSVSQLTWNLRKQLSISEGVIIFKDKLFVPISLRYNILISGHYGHNGRDTMLSNIQQSYFWPKMSEDIVTYISNCRTCSKVRPSFRRPPIQTLLSDSPLQMIAVDFIGPLPESQGMKYIFVVIDSFSRFPECYPISSLKTDDMINCFRDYFSRYGFPDSILSDRGAQFTSEMYIAFLKNLGIKRLLTTAYHPSANGLCERFNGTLQRKLLALLDERNLTKEHWVSVMAPALFAYRNDVHSTTGYTPSQLIFSFNTKDFNTLKRSRYMGIEDIAQVCTNIEHNRRLKTKNIKTVNQTFSPGQEVLIKAISRAKLDPRGYEATVTHQRNSHVVEVDMGGKPQVVSSSRIAPLPQKPLPVMMPLPEEQGEDNAPDENVTRRSRRLTRYPDKFNDYLKH